MLIVFYPLVNKGGQGLLVVNSAVEDDFARTGINYIDSEKQ